MALIERLQKATAGTPELNRAILDSFGFKWRGMDYWNDAGEVWRGPTSFTYSVDAALTLVPAGLDWMIGRGRILPADPLFGVQIFPANSGRMVEMPPPVAEAEHALLPIAVAIAALKARIVLAALKARAT